MKKNLVSIWFFTIYATLFLIPFQQNITRLLLIAIPVIALIILIVNKKVYGNKLLFLPVIFFLIEFIWVFIDKNNISVRLGHLDSQLAIFLIPMSFLIVSPDLISKNKKKFFFSYILGNLGASLVALSFSAFMVWHNGHVFNANTLDRYFEKLHHHTFFSINALIALLLIMYLILKTELPGKIRWFLYVTFVILNIAIYVAASRAGMFLAVLISAFFIWRLLDSLFKPWVKYLAILLFLTLFIVSITNRSSFSYLRTGEKSFIERILTENKQSVRKLIWYKALQEGWQAFPIGEGTGTISKSMSRELHKEIENGLLDIKFPNAHNQFIESFFETGLVGIVSLLSMLLIPLWLAIRRKHFLLFQFLFVIIGISLIESIFKRQWGVESFVIVYSILCIDLLSKPSNSLANTSA